MSLAVVVDEPLEIRLTPESPSTFWIESPADRYYLGLSVPQRGSDLAIDLYDPNGLLLETSNLSTNPREREEFYFVAEHPGFYRLAVRVVSSLDHGLVETTVQRTEFRPASDDEEFRIEAWKAYARGRSALSMNGDLSEAISLFGQALELWRALDDPLWIASTLDNLGTCRRRSGDPSAAILEYELALGEWRRASYAKGRMTTLINLGLTFRQLGHLESSDSSYRQALAIAGEESLGGRYLSQIHNNLGAVLELRGDAIAASTHLERAVRLRREAGPSQALARSLINLGSVKTGLAEFESARAILEEARQMAEATNATDSVAAALANLGLLSAWEGRPARALSAYRRALDLHRETGNRIGEAEVLRNLGTLYLDFGEYEHALGLYRQHRTLLTELGRRAEAASAQVNIGSVLDLQGAIDAAVENYEQAMAVLDTQGGPSARASVLEKIGSAIARSGEVNQGRQYLVSALEVARTHGLKMRELKILLQLARIEEQAGDRVSAHQLYSTADQLAGVFPARLELAESQIGLARTETDMDEAWAHAKKAISYVESVRGAAFGPYFRSAILAQRLEYYRFGIDLLYRRYESLQEPQILEDLFMLAERSQAREMLEKLREQERGRRLGEDPARVAQEQQVLRRLETLENLDSRIEIQGQKELIAERRARLQEELLTEYRELQATNRLVGETLVAEEELTLEELQRVLNPGELVVYFIPVESRAILLALTSDSAEVHSIPDYEILGTDISALLQALRFPSERPFNGSSTERSSWEARKRLHRARLPLQAERVGAEILGSISHLLDHATTLVTVVRGELTRVPFAVLGKPGAGEYYPLVRHCEIARTPSLSALAKLRARARSRLGASKGLMLIGDPLMSVDQRVPRKETNLGESNGWHHPFAANAVRLPYTQEEVRAIGALSPPDIETTTLIGPEASKQRLLELNLETYRYLHFATHGWVDDRNPELSALALSLFDQGGNPLAGLLRVHEIEALYLYAELATLSACQTGVGQELPGEGLLSLARSFLLAGSSQVIASLWQIDDAATEQFMGIFYDKLFSESLQPVAALRAAQLQMLDQAPREEWQHPYYWAAFALYGDWHPPQEP